MYPAWFFLHGLLLLGSTAALALAAVLGGRRADRSRPAAAAALVLVAGALALVPVQVGVLLALASYGPDFALERLPLGVPLTLVTLLAVAALGGLRRAATGGAAGERAGGRTAVRVALVAALLQWHLLLVPPTTDAAVLGTGLAYVALLVGTVPLLRPRPRLARPARVPAGGLVAVTGPAQDGRAGGPRRLSG